MRVPFFLGLRIVEDPLLLRGERFASRHETTWRQTTSRRTRVMSGVLTPHNQKIKSKARNKTPLSKSPHPVGLLSPNDDQLERQKSLLSREAEEAMRRDFAKELDENAESAPVKKPSKLEELTDAASAGPRPVKKLSAEAVLSLYTNCIKLASENKINSKNTWSLALIDHISDIVKNEKDEDNQTNFQKASCTLEAGVKIYASRVDSFHNETFKMLGGMNKVSSNGEEEEDARQGLGDGAEGSQLPEDGEGMKTKKRRAAVNTLEQPEAHSMKQLDETLVVDPLFQKTSAMFDEGGASGLLLTNLSVHKGCNICFDSEEVPDYTKGDEMLTAGTLDLSSLRSSIEVATSAMESISRITPSIDAIQTMLTEVTGVAPIKASEKTTEGESGSFFANSTLEGVNFAEYDDEEDVAEESPEDWAVGGDGFGDENWTEDGDRDRAVDDTVLSTQEGGLEWIVSSGLGGKMCWAGPSHWQFRAPPRPKQSPHGDEEGESRGKKKRGKGELTYDFENPTELDERRFELAVDEDDLLLASAPSASDTLLPPDLGYEASNLIKLFLKSQNVAGLVHYDLSMNQDMGEFASPPVDDPAEGEFDEGEELVGEAGGWYEAGEFDEDGDLIDAPRRVEKIEVNYARTAKQVNVRALKQTLWSNLEESTSHEEVHSFNEILREFPIDNPAGHVEDISVHMAFICALHLANEHGLVINSVPTMDDMCISNVPCEVK